MALRVTRKTQTFVYIYVIRPVTTATVAVLAASFSFGCAAYSAAPRPSRPTEAETFAAPPGTPVNRYGAPRSTVKVPMFFPIAGSRSGFSDSWGSARVGHRHIGQDLFAPKLTPLIAAFDGYVYLWQNGNSSNPHFALTITGDNGYRVKYMHINNDSPGTNDGQGGTSYAYAPGLQSGQRVRAGQFLGWVGNSGNAETTPPHLHFELWTDDGPTNAYASLRAATRLPAPRVPQEVRDGLPRLALSKGETRLDGIVYSADGVRGVVALTPLVETRGPNTRTVTKPGLRWVRLANSGTVVRAVDPAQSVRLSSLRFGDRIAIVGTASKSRGNLVARRIAVAEPESIPSYYGGLLPYRITSPLQRVTPPGAAEPTIEERPPDASRAVRRLGNQISDWWNGVRRRGRL